MKKLYISNTNRHTSKLKSEKHPKVKKKKKLTGP